MTGIQYAKSGDAHIAYDTVGDGPIDLLVTMEGFVPLDMLDEEPRIARVMRRLASFCRVIRFNRRGIGLSDPCAPSEPPTLEQWADDALAVMDAAASERAAVLAGSEVSSLAFVLAAAHPERISAVAVVNGFARTEWAPDYDFGYTRARMDEIMAGIVAPADGDGEGAREFAPSAADDPVFQRWWLQAGRRGASPATARALLTVVLESDVRDVLPAIRVPTVVMFARDYASERAEASRYIADHVPDAKLVELPSPDEFWWVGNATDMVVDEVEELLTGARGSSTPDRVLATVLFTDIVGSTSTAVAAGDRAWATTLDGYEATVRREVDRYAGRIVKSTGDGALATFDGPARAIRCAGAIRDRAEVDGLQSRSGLHAGEVELRGQDIAGVAVHVAARISGIAASGEVLASSTVRDLVAGSGIEFTDRGEHTLRGFPEPWKLFAVDL